MTRRGWEPVVPGSGLHVGIEGVSCNHHFLMPKDGTEYKFLPGDHRLSVYASVVGCGKPQLLAEVGVTLDRDAASYASSGVCFDWSPDSCRYHAHNLGQPFNSDPNSQP